MHTKLGCLEPNSTIALRYALGEVEYEKVYKKVFDSFDKELPSHSSRFSERNVRDLEEAALSLFTKYEICKYIWDGWTPMKVLSSTKTKLYKAAIDEVALLVAPYFESSNPNDNNHKLRRYMSDHLKVDELGLVLSNDLFDIYFYDTKDFNYEPFHPPIYTEAGHFLFQFSNLMGSVHYKGGDVPLVIAEGVDFSIAPYGVMENYNRLYFTWGNEYTLRDCYIKMVYLTYLKRLEEAEDRAKVLNSVSSAISGS